MSTMKKRLNILLSLIMAVVVVSAFSVSPVLAGAKTSEMTPIEKAKAEKKLGDNDKTEGDPYETGEGVHADPAVFEKDFILKPAQKIETIQAMQRVVSKIIDDDMSDLEKYYILALWTNKHVVYDWDFWTGCYNFEYYSHQWDSYGGIKDGETSVCAGIAVFYANMCHAAGLPCKFVRLNPSYLDHTISYIPNINDHAYLVDVTENVFLMSEQSGNAFQDLDKAFSNITQDADDETFDYYEGGEPTSSSIRPDEDNTKWPYSDFDDETKAAKMKNYCKTAYEKWFKEYAKHEGTEKDFRTPYDEKGSGTGHYVDYVGSESNRTSSGDIWFLDDFYRNPTELKEKIKNKEFDEQLINLSGLKKNYDSNDEEELLADVANDINKVEYFPSADNDNNIVAEVDELESTDYELTCEEFDKDKSKAVLKLEGKGAYSGTCSFTVRLKSATVSEDPVIKRGLVYNGTPQALVNPGVAEHGVMQYALGTKEEPTEEFSTEIPTGTDAKKYYVWYKAAGEEGYADSDAQRMEWAAPIARLLVDILVDKHELNLEIGETATITPKLSTKIPARFTFESQNEDVVVVDDKGVVTAVGGGSTPILVEVVLREDSSNYNIDDLTVVWAEVKPEPFDLSETKVRFNKSSFTYNGKVQRPTINTIKGWKLEEGVDYKVKWSNKSSKNAGTYTAVITGIGDFTGSTDATYTINKAANPMKVKAKKVAVKAKSLKKKAKSIARSKTLKVSNAKGKLSYRITAAKKGKSKKNLKNKFKINAKTGKITVKKGLKKGTYKVTVKVKAKGTANYKASAWKTVKVKVMVK